VTLSSHTHTHTRAHPSTLPQYGSIIQLRKRGDNTKWVAELLAYGPECDLAVLTVKDDRFWEGLEPIEFGELPALLDDVSVVRAMSMWLVVEDDGGLAA